MADTHLKPPPKQASPHPTDDDETESEKEEEDETLDDSTEDLIILNVGGRRHETRRQTLRKLLRKSTRLLDIADESERSGRKEFYFDRHPDFFPFILNFYRTGKLHLPLNMCGPLIKEELLFWQIDDKDIEQCCWVHYIKYEETLEMIDMFEKDDKIHRLATKRISKDASWFQKKRPKLWRFLQDSYSSKAAMAYAFISLSIVLLSITVFIIETLPYFKSLYVHARQDRKNVTSQDLREEIDIFNNISPLSILLIIDHSCNLFFLCELIVKLIAAPYKREFLRSPQTIVEFVCLIPYYVAVIIVFYHPDPLKIFDLIRLLISLRVLRIFRIFVLMKHFLALKILMYTIQASTKELFLLLLVVLIGVVIFACIVYYMEMFSDQETQFAHIPIACWWALVTMTTVGYGDMVPTTGQGYAAGAVCALCGVLVIALSVPAIVQNFTLYYTHAQSRLKLKQRKRIYRQKKWSHLKNFIKGQSGEATGFAKIVSMAREESNKKRRKSAAVAPISNPMRNGDVKNPKPRSHSVAVGLSKGDVSSILKKLKSSSDKTNEKKTSSDSTATNSTDNTEKKTKQSKVKIITPQDNDNNQNDKESRDKLPFRRISSDDRSKGTLPPLFEEKSETENKTDEIQSESSSVALSRASSTAKQSNISTVQDKPSDNDSLNSSSDSEIETDSDNLFKDHDQSSKVDSKNLWTKLKIRKQSV